MPSKKYLLITVFLSLIGHQLQAQYDTTKYTTAVHETYNRFINTLKLFEGAKDTAGLRKKAAEVIGNEIFFLLSSGDPDISLKNEKAKDEIISLSYYLNSEGSSGFSLRSLDSVKDATVFLNVDKEVRHWIFVMTKLAMPQEPLFYFLFIPGEYLKREKPLILSWKICYMYGQYVFEDAAGQVGAEGFFYRRH